MVPLVEPGDLCKEASVTLPISAAEDGFERSGAARVGYGERNVDQKPIIGSQEFKRRHQPEDILIDE